MIADFLLRAALGGIGLALVAGPVGCFVVWRRMAYSGDSLAHSALLGIALGFLLGIDPTLGLAATAVVRSGPGCRPTNRNSVAACGDRAR